MNHKSKNNKKEERIISLIEIILMISLTITTAYFVNEASKDAVEINVNNTGLFGKIMEAIGKIIFGDKGIVSALDSTDLQNGVSTCLKTKNNSICQEFPASECASQCASDCIPAGADQLSQCQIGTCYDPLEGTCSAGAPQQACTDHNGQWFDDPNGNIAQCKRGCCIIGENANFVTAQQCKRSSTLLGITTNFKPEITTEVACVLQAKVQETGACVFDSEFEKTCKFTTRADCLNLKGQFNSNYLCSAKELGTNCKPQATTGCVGGKDEVYWFDSCGNRENIYDANKVASYNNGKVLSKNESCSLGTTGNVFANKNTCGNCNYLAGSTCGIKEKTDGIFGNSICKDLRCTDENGKVRQNGESWCTYESSIGVDNGVGVTKDGTKLQRSVDTAGSRQFREVCSDGTVRTEPCADFRNEVCIEAQTKTTSTQTFSSAACRINGWQQCIEYNTELQTKDNPNGITVEQRDTKCTQNSDCFLKNVDLGKTFQFSMCAPKTPPGFDLSSQDKGESIKNICSLASQKCTEVWVKDMGGSWGCVANCQCHTTKFSEQLNDMCISLGDCGTKANVQGDITYNSKVFQSNNAKKLGKDVTLKGKGWFPADYTSALKKYSDYSNSPNKFVAPGNLTEFYASLGVPSGVGGAQTPSDPAAQLQMMSMVSGAMGIFLAQAAITGAGAAGTAAVAGMGGLTAADLGPEFVAEFGTEGAPFMQAAGGVLAGAAIGFAVVSMLIKFTGIGPAIGEEGAYALMAAGAVAGAIMGFTAAGVAAAGGNPLTLAAICMFPPACILFAAIIVFIIVEALLGAGQIKKVSYTFQCQPWQAPLGGGNCNKCGKDGLPCGKYECQSLGQTCQYINEGTGQEQCVNVNPNDVTPPTIKPLDGVITDGFTYTGLSDNGFSVKSNESDGCIKSYQNVIFGIQTIDEKGGNDASYCKYETNHTSTFEDMQNDFGGSNLYLVNHTQGLMIPSLDSLGIPSYDPNARQDYNLYVRCQDKSGNANMNEFNINFCVKPGLDITPPIVTAQEPVYNWLKYDATDVNASVFTNEPGDCKWDVSDKSYDDMTNQMQCDNALSDQELLGWRCSDKFPISGNETTLYVKCQDQPWLVNQSGQMTIKVYNYTDSQGNDVYSYIDAAGRQRNTMPDSYLLTFKKTSSQLNIDYIKPNNETIISGVQPVSVKVEVGTSGGVDGNAKCYYKIGDQYIQFKNTFGKVHGQTFENFLAGEKVLPVRCIDLAGNVAEKTADFNILLDTQTPIVTRVYNSNGLNVVTNEKSTCAYSSTSCAYNFDNGTLMDGDGLVHSTAFNINSIYYIKCKDVYGNTPGDCNIVVKGVDLTETGNNGGKN